MKMRNTVITSHQPDSFIFFPSHLIIIYDKNLLEFFAILAEEQTQTDR